MLSYPDFKEKTIVIVFANYGQKFSILNDNLIVKDVDDKLILQSTCYKVLSLWVVGNCTITSGLLERSKKFGFPIQILSYGFRSIGSWNTPTEGNFLLRMKQYQYSDLIIAKHLIKNKIDNQILLIKSIRKKEVNCINAIQNLTNYKNGLCELTRLEEIMGLEGVSSKVFFNQYFSELGWKGRKPRTKIDPINVVLDIGYTYLFYIIENMLNLYGFDIYKGVYHTNFFKRKSLVCDLQEPFRCIIDKQIKRAYGLGQIKESDFDFKRGQYFLKNERGKEYTKWMLSSILEYKSSIFLYCQSYYRAFMREKSIDHYPLFNIMNPK